VFKNDPKQLARDLEKEFGLPEDRRRRRGVPRKKNPAASAPTCGRALGSLLVVLGSGTIHEEIY
jgi:hypothetical protein